MIRLVLSCLERKSPATAVTARLLLAILLTIPLISG
jgi:hypothetical protein